MNKAFFFDRDGIVNKRIVGDYVKEISNFEFIPEFFDIFELICTKNYIPILVTNQQGIGKNLMTEEQLIIVHDYMNKNLFDKTGYRFTDIYYCTDLAGSGSSRRKPAPGMLLEAAEKHNIDLPNSIMLGDSKSDIQAGKNAGCINIYIGNPPYELADHCFKDHSDLLQGINSII